MPLYEYRCHSCGKTIEVIQKFSDEPLTVHEECGGALEKLISRSALQFKGSGWYVTDYGKGGVVPKNTDGKNGDGKSSDSKSEASSESSASSKSSDSKSSDASASEAKASESKPVSEPASKPAPVSASSDSK